jgi:putative FmdB family regulatory protein
MPIYEYRRPNGSTFEVLQAFTDDPLQHDPDTGVPVERVLHAPAVHFKGKGFYNTDYGTRKRQRETAASADGSSSGNGASSENSSSGGGSEGSSGGGSEGSSGGTSEGSSGSASEKKEAAASGGGKAKTEKVVASKT